MLVSDTETTVSSYTQLATAISSCPAASSCRIAIETPILMLDPDVPLSIDSGKVISIRGKSSGIFITSNGNSSLFVVSDKSSLLLTSLLFNISTEQNLNAIGASILQVYSSILLLNETVFIGARALRGSAVAAEYSTVHITRSEFSSNAISQTTNTCIDDLGSGGALYILGGSVCVEDSSFVNNSAVRGGALYVENSKNVTIFRTSFVNNRVLLGSGGGFCAVNSDVLLEDSWGRGNIAAGTDSNGGFLSLQQTSRGNFLRIFCHPNNNALVGGCISVFFSSFLRCLNCTMMSSEYHSQSFNLMPPSRGGAMYVGFQSQVEFIDGSVVGYVAGFGGAFSVEYSSSILFNGTFLGNNTAVFSGGGIYVDFLSTATLIHSTMESNSALQGGAIFCDFDGLGIFIQNSRITYSFSEFEGSALYSNNCTVHLTHSVINFNSGSQHTLKITLGLADTLITFCDISQNTVSGEGAALSLYGDVGIQLGNFLVSDSNFSQNSAEYDGGGILASNEARGRISRCFFDKNYAGYKGGAIHIQSRSVVEIEKCIFQENWYFCFKLCQH
jgi:predicted outer membrane repeat protein